MCNFKLFLEYVEWLQYLQLNGFSPKTSEEHKWIHVYEFCFGKYSQKANKNKVNKIVLIMLNVGNHNSD